MSLLINLIAQSLMVVGIAGLIAVWGVWRNDQPQPAVRFPFLRRTLWLLPGYALLEFLLINQASVVAGWHLGLVTIPLILAVLYLDIFLALAGLGLSIAFMAGMDSSDFRTLLAIKWAGGVVLAIGFCYRNRVSRVCSLERVFLLGLLVSLWEISVALLLPQDIRYSVLSRIWLAEPIANVLSLLAAAYLINHFREQHPAIEICKPADKVSDRQTQRPSFSEEPFANIESKDSLAPVLTPSSSSKSLQGNDTIKLRAILKTLPEMVFHLDREGKYLDFFPGTEATPYVEPELFIGRNIYEVLPPQSAAFIMERIKKALASGDQQFCEYTLPDKSKTAVDFFEARITPLNETEVICVVSDVTQEKLTASALNESERHTAALVRNLPGAVFRFFFDVSVQIDYLSANIYDLLKYRPDELINNASSNLADIIHPDDYPSFISEIEKAARDVTPFVVTCRVESRDGVYHWLSFRGTAVLEMSDAGHMQTLLEGFVYDVTERQLANELQLWRNEVLECIVTEDSLGELVASLNGFGAKPEIAIGLIVGVFDSRENTVCVYHGKNRIRLEGSIDEWMDKDQETISQASVRSICNLFSIRADKPEYLFVQLLMNSRKQAIGFVVAVREKQQFESLQDDYLSTAARLAEVALEHRQTNRDNVELQKGLLQAQKMESLGQLTGGVAHDFNNILSSIIGYAELMAMSPEVTRSEKLSGYLQNVIRSGERAKDLIKQMLSYSRLNNEPARPMPIAVALEDTLSLIRPVLPATMEIETDCSVDAEILSNPTQFHQVLMNLFINARDALNEKGKVSVKVQSASFVNQECASCHRHFSGEYIDLCVQDNGGGISQELLSRIFDPFFSTKEVGQGTGMGLAVVHGIVHDHDGHIQVESAPELGTRFHILFRLAEESAHPETAVDNVVSAMPELRASQQVLVIDDEVVIADMLKEMLEMQGLQVTVVHSAREALGLVNTQHFDLVISDQTMPDMTGEELAKRIGSMEVPVPVVLCTGHLDQVRKLQQSEGISRVVTKPLAMKALMETVDSILFRSLSSRKELRG